MKAMILGAGAGTRLRPITKKIPKPMFPIINKPVLEFLIELLKEHKISEIMINISHLGYVIQDYIRDGYRYGVNVGYSFEGKFVDGILEAKPIGSAGGIKKIQEERDFFDDTFIVLCGDSIIDLDITAALKFHREHGALATIITRKVEREQIPNYGIVVTDSDSRVLSFQEKPSIEEALSDIANTGIYIFEPEVLDFIPAGEFYDIGSQLFPKLVSLNKRVYAVTMDFNWFDIGRNSEYISILKKALNLEIPGFVPSGKEIMPGIYTGAGVKIHPDAELTPPVYIGPGALIEAGARIKGPSIIGANSIIGQEAEICESFISDYTEIKKNGILNDMMITPEYYVFSDGSTRNTEGSEFEDFISDVRTEK